jgi:glycosyltransferase involved in cell wall biosynthesis
VVIACNEGANLRATVEQFQATLPGGSEIVVVDDGSTDGSADFLRHAKCAVRLLSSKNLGVAKARNWGARQSRGNIIVFADAHIRLPRRWWVPMVELLENPKVGAVAPGIGAMGESHLKGYGLYLTGADLAADWLRRKNRGDYPVPILPGCCMALRRDVFEASGGNDEGMIRSGGVDNELCLRLWLLGYELRLVPGIVVQHLFSDRNYPMRWRNIVHNRLRLAFVHFDRRRIRRVVDALRDSPGFGEGLTLTVGSDLAQQRAQLRARRVRDENWVFEKFGHNW